MSRVKELQHLVAHLEFFGNFHDVEVPTWVRPAVKQALAYNRPDLAMNYLKGQLKIEEILAANPSKKAMLEVLGFDKKDLSNPEDDVRLEQIREQKERQRNIEQAEKKFAREQEEKYRRIGKEMKKKD